MTNVEAENNSFDYGASPHLVASDIQQPLRGPTTGSLPCNAASSLQATPFDIKRLHSFWEDFLRALYFYSY